MQPAQFRARVEQNRVLRGGYFVLTFRTDAPVSMTETTPGQFVMVRGPWDRDPINPRAFSVLDAERDDTFSILAKVYGRGTARLQAMHPGDPVTVTGPLGRGFPEPKGRQLLVAGGVGLPPLHLQARRAAASGAADKVEVLYGGRGADDLVLLDDLERFGVDVHLATEDGSVGHHGFVTGPLSQRVDALETEDVSILACGPTPMLKAVRTFGLQRKITTLLCLEEEMACGFGVCLGCAVPVYGPKPYQYCCSDGPVFDATRVRWP